MSDANYDDEMILHTSPVVRGALLVVGTLSVVLGVIGAFLPVLPTTPFLLLAAGCYARSSRKFYVWLVSNRVFGKYIRDWRAGLGIPRNAKILATTMITVTIGTSAALFIPATMLWVKLLMIAIGVGVVAYIWWLPTRRNDPPDREGQDPQ